AQSRLASDADTISMLDSSLEHQSISCRLLTEELIGLEQLQISTLLHASSEATQAVVEESSKAQGLVVRLDGWLSRAEDLVASGAEPLVGRLQQVGRDGCIASRMCSRPFVCGVVHWVVSI
ncbi:MAG: hypothetical protein SGPRY_006764, partial [Prymnesium sp.]